MSTDTFNNVMVTKALSPMRLVEAFEDLVTPTGRRYAVRRAGDGRTLLLISPGRVRRRGRLQRDCATTAPALH